MKHGSSAVVTALCAVAVVASGCSRDTQSKADARGCDPGISDTEVVIGASTLQSGAAAAYKVGPETISAYFESLNANGGVRMGDGKTRKITYIPIDDAFDPARTVANTKTLVEEKKVFAIFGVTGTSPNLAIVDYTNKMGVPLAFSVTGSGQLLQKAKDGALVAGVPMPEGRFEITAMVRAIAESNPNAKIAVLRSNDGYGTETIKYVRDAANASGVTMVAEQTYEQTSPSVDSQVVKLKDSGADVFMALGTGAFMTMAIKKAHELGWKVERWVNSSSTDVASILAPAGPGAANGVRSVAWLYDVSGSSNDSAEGVQRWRTFAESTGGKVDSHNFISAIAYNNAQLMEATFKRMNGCTRADLMDAAQNLKNVDTDLVLDGLSWNTTPDYPFAIRTVALEKFDGKSWVYGKTVTLD